MDVLIALGTSAAYFYSLYVTMEWTVFASGETTTKVCLLVTVIRKRDRRRN